MHGIAIQGSSFATHWELPTTRSSWWNSCRSSPLARLIYEGRGRGGSWRVEKIKLAASWLPAPHESDPSFPPGGRGLRPGGMWTSLRGPEREVCATTRPTRIDRQGNRVNRWQLRLQASGQWLVAIDNHLPGQREVQGHDGVVADQRRDRFVLVRSKVEDGRGALHNHVVDLREDN